LAHFQLCSANSSEQIYKLEFATSCVPKESKDSNTFTHEPFTFIALYADRIHLNQAQTPEKAMSDKTGPRSSCPDKAHN